jgi:hypothetical protein
MHYEKNETYQVITEKHSYLEPDGSLSKLYSAHVVNLYIQRLTKT